MKNPCPRHLPAIVPPVAWAGLALFFPVQVFVYHLIGILLFRIIPEIGRNNSFIMIKNQEATMVIVAEIKTGEGNLLSVMALPPKEFKTGSKGFYANGKLEIEGKRYQVQIQMVEIGSKGQTSEEK
jgi:hypothetical protein